MPRGPRTRSACDRRRYDGAQRGRSRRQMTVTGLIRLRFATIAGVDPPRTGRSDHVPRRGEPRAPWAARRAATAIERRTTPGTRRQGCRSRSEAPSPDCSDHAGLAEIAQPKWTAWLRRSKPPDVPEELTDILEHIATFADPLLSGFPPTGRWKPGRFRVDVTPFANRPTNSCARAAFTILEQAQSRTRTRFSGQLQVPPDSCRTHLHHPVLR